MLGHIIPTLLSEDITRAASRVVLDPGSRCPTLAATNSSVGRFAAAGTSSGDHTAVETPVPIPNTVVKHRGPMIVPTSAKVGIARLFYF
jgi:hypothetical protein